MVVSNLKSRRVEISTFGQDKEKACHRAGATKRLDRLYRIHADRKISLDVEYVNHKGVEIMVRGFDVF